MPNIVPIVPKIDNDILALLAKTDKNGKEEGGERNMGRRERLYRL
jgi:hypothetical protein